MRASSIPRLFFLFVLYTFSTSAFSQQITDYLVQPEKSESYVLLREGRKDFGFGLMDSKSELAWTIPVPGEPLGMGKLGNDIIVIYAEEYKIMHSIEVVHAMLVDPGKKKILKDIVIYNNPGNLGLEVEVLQDETGNFSCVLARESTLKQASGGFGSFGNGGSFAKTKTFTMIQLNDKFLPKPKELNSLVMESDYFGSFAGSNNEFYACSYGDGQLTAERFDGNGNKLSQLRTAVTFNKKFTHNFVAQYDSLRQNCLHLALAYSDEKKDRLIPLYNFDFNTKKISKTDLIAYDKNYVKTLKAPLPDLKIIHFGSIQSLRPLQIINTPDKTIVIKEIQSFKPAMQGYPEQYIRESAIISIYNRDLKLIRDIPISKWSWNGLVRLHNIYGHVKADKLYLVTNEKDDLGYQGVLYVINLQDYSMVFDQIPDPEKGINWLANPTKVLWYNSKFMVPFLNAKASPFKLKLNTSWASLKY